MARTTLAVKLALRSTLTFAVGIGGGVLLAPTDAATVVTPDVYESSEAPDWSSSSWSSQFRAMFISDSSQFSDLPPGGATLTEIALRPDQTAQVGQLLQFGRLELSVAVTQVDPADISFVFDDNLTVASQVVYDAPWNTMVVHGQPSDSSTRPFDFRVPLDTPFFYDPADGNLVVDWLMLTPSYPQARFDLRLESPVEGQAGVRGSSDLQVASSGPFSVVHQFTFATNSTGDFNDDGVVDGIDLLEWQRDPSVGDLAIWEQNYGSGSTGSAAVPEVSSVALLVIGIALVCARRCC